MGDKYEGWTLYEKVIIVEKIVYNYDYGLGKRIKTDEKQGYIVDSKNKKQLETAMSWAETKEYDYNPETKRNEIIKVNKGIIHEFQNEDFEIELLDSAEGSSQGGKLSFWNCKISKDDKSWIIGINADLLLKCLKSCTWVNGKCQDKVMFARCKGGVGVLSKNSPEYIKAQSDMASKANMSKGKTSKYELGHCYETVTESDVYFGKIYKWYDPIYSKSSSYYRYEGPIGFKLREKPKVKELLLTKFDKLNKASEYLTDNHRGCIFYKDKCPARKEGDYKVEWDITNEDIDKFLKNQNYYNSGGEYFYISSDRFGFSTDPSNPLRYTEEEKEFFKNKLHIEIED